MMATLLKVFAGAVPIIALLVGAAFVVPPDFPLLLRQLILFAIGVGGIAAAERLLFGGGMAAISRALGFNPTGPRAIVAAIVVSLPMWGFIPVYCWLSGTALPVNPEWLPMLAGVVLVNGIAEEVTHRAFVFGHLRHARSFTRAALLSAAIFALQHVYLVLTIGPIPGATSIGLALLLSFPLAFLYERGGNSIVGPAILHTSSNAPMMLLTTPALAESIILPHMAVVLTSIYLVFLFRSWLPDPTTTVTEREPRLASAPAASELGTKRI
jgi:membrane protease YdiL (CAAX protease family)